MNTSSISTISSDKNEQQMQWNASVQRYNEIMGRNYEIRVETMSENDLIRYYHHNNIAQPSKECVLEHMRRWGGFRSLVINGGLFKEKSDLFERLLSGKDALDFPPPRKHGRPWYALFDEPGSYECKPEEVRADKRAHRRAGQHDVIILIDGCPWEIARSSTAAGKLLALQQQWQDATAASDLAAKSRVSKAGGVHARSFKGEIAMVLRFGQWPYNFSLTPAKGSPRDSEHDAPLSLMKWQIEVAWGDDADIPRETDSPAPRG